MSYNIKKQASAQKGPEVKERKNIMAGYPRVEINLEKIRHNAKNLCEMCAEQGVKLTGVIKGVNGIPEVMKVIDESPVMSMASSRIEHLEAAVKMGCKKPMMLIRMPMLSEIEQVITYTDYSLNTEMTVIEALNKEAEKQGKVHKVVIMADTGDLREGYWDKQEMIRDILYIEKELKNIEFAGIGTNLGCYGSVQPTVAKLTELADLAKEVEAAVGHPLEIVSGGASGSIARILEKNMPAGINHLRVGGEMINAYAMHFLRGYDMPNTKFHPFKIKAEIIEIKDKPTYPVGELGVYFLGGTPAYVDRGIRKRAIIAMGRLDYGDPSTLIIDEPGVEVIGASSDHTILDIQDAEKEYKVGDIVTFTVRYAQMMYVTMSPTVKKVFVEGE